MVRLLTLRLSVLLQDAVESIFHLNLGTLFYAFCDFMPFWPNSLPLEQNLHVLDECPLLARNLGVDCVNPPLTALAGRPVVLQRVETIEHFCYASPFFRLGVCDSTELIDFLRHLFQDLSLIGGPTGLCAALLLDKQPPLLTLDLRATWHKLRHFVPVFLGQLVSVFLFLVQLSEYDVLQQKGFIFFPLPLRHDGVLDSLGL